MSHRFKVGDTVTKVSGQTRFWGVVKAVYHVQQTGQSPTTEHWRYDVMAIHPEFYGLIHIYSDKDLAHVAV